MTSIHLFGQTGPLHEKHLDHLKVVVEAGDMQGRPALVILSVDDDVGEGEEVDEGDQVALVGRQVQGRPSVTTQLTFVHQILTHQCRIVLHGLR